MKVHILFFVFICILINLCPAFEVDSVNLHLYLSGLDKAQAPVIIENNLVLSASGPYRFVGAAFSHEQWRKIHPFEINRNGIFILAIPIPYGEATSIQYRFIIDGLWTADPSNPDSVRDKDTGALLSIAHLPENSKTRLGTWNPGGEGCAMFYFQGQSGNRVTVSGTFNGWDPFIHDLIETSPGIYELTLKLVPGEYFYVFNYRGERISDPLNNVLFHDKFGRQVSSLVVR
jgi:1,4-alpha-glucan branching enzyme